MASMYDIEKQIESINEQLKAICLMLGIDVINKIYPGQPVIEEPVTDPDA